MRKILSLLIFLALLSGCITSGKAYIFRTSDKYDGGYIIDRKGVIIPEYTIGRDNQAPQDLELAKLRFRRRKGTVDKYYKKMGVIIDSNVEMGKTFGGMFTEPFILPSKIVDYNRYKNDPEYRKKIDEEEEMLERQEQERIEQLKQELAEWIENDLDKEESGQ